MKNERLEDKTNARDDSCRTRVDSGRKHPGEEADPSLDSNESFPIPEIKYRQGDDRHYILPENDDRQVSLEEFERILKFRLSVDGAIAQMGIKVTDMEVGWARAEMEYSSAHRNPNGSVHGGMIFSLADSVAGTAACTHGSMVTTSTGSIYFLHAAFRPKKLIAEAMELKAGRNLMVYDVKVKTDTGKLVAKAVMEYFNLNMPIPRGNKREVEGEEKE